VQLADLLWRARARNRVLASAYAAVAQVTLFNWKLWKCFAASTQYDLVCGAMWQG